jgi:amidase
MAPHGLTAAEAIRLLSSGQLTSEALVTDCLRRIAEGDSRVQAWEFLDPALALAQARRADAAGRPGPLHGLPIGVKDTFDTADMPTACGMALFAGRRPHQDAACVATLRRAGAVMLGKTVTTELAFYAPGRTRNPHDPSRTPGGSSSGSAAAVAAAMVPAALGSQTAGSLIRPASYCGVVGFKPSHGLVPLTGVAPLAPGSLDTIGVLVRSVADLPPLAAALGVPVAAPPLPVPLRIGLCRTEAWPLAGPESQAAVQEAARRLADAGAAVDEESERFDGLCEGHRTAMAFEAHAAWGASLARQLQHVSPQLQGLLADGARVTLARHAQALAVRDQARSRLAAIFARFDVLLTASAQGEAPAGLASTGDPALNRIWTLLGLPCLTLPAATGPHGLPIGVQLVGAPGGDAALLAAAGWVEGVLCSR